jgi:hypothetical protein
VLFGAVGLLGREASATIIYSGSSARVAVQVSSDPIGEAQDSVTGAAEAFVGEALLDFGEPFVRARESSSLLPDSVFTEGMVLIDPTFEAEGLNETISATVSLAVDFSIEQDSAWSMALNIEDGPYDFGGATAASGSLTVLLSSPLGTVSMFRYGMPGPAESGLVETTVFNDFGRLTPQAYSLEVILDSEMYSFIGGYSTTSYDLAFKVAPIPEPHAAVMFALGALLVGLVGRTRA